MSKRRQLTGEQKVAIVRAHLLDGVPTKKQTEMQQKLSREIAATNRCFAPAGRILFSVC